MSSAPTDAITKAHEKARILWRHWHSDEVQEGYVREVSPSWERVRISRTPGSKDKGEWYECAKLRCVEVLQRNFDFAAVRKKEKADRTMPFDLPGDEWKNADDDPAT